MTPATIAVSIDLDAPGKRIGHLELLWSDDEHAYGVIPVPIAVIANGNGPSVLVTAGVHGDEYEGLVIARKLIAELAPDAISGRIVVMPGVNWPAVRARRRVSPIDRKNMNRIFPGDGTSGPTAMIADFIERRLLPGMAYAVDLHSGGTQSVFDPCGYVYGTGERAFREGSSPPRTRSARPEPQSSPQHRPAGRCPRRASDTASRWSPPSSVAARRSAMPGSALAGKARSICCAMRAY